MGDSVRENATPMTLTITISLTTNIPILPHLFLAHLHDCLGGGICRTDQVLHSNRPTTLFLTCLTRPKPL
ncbi:MAG: hypothetical protein M9930_18555 [Anaerolineae bacterium]|nr:hypothetical protein [Anaerolineae bacterium]